MKNYPLWKSFIVFLIIIFAFVFAIPSIIYKEDTGNWFLENKINLGLDLQGGSYLLLEVESEILFKEELRTIKFHFDVMHKDGNLEKAVKLLNENDRSEFNDYVNNETSLHCWNLLCCRSKIILDKWYQSVFDWLFKCEDIFSFKSLSGYDKRLYGYLAERYLSFWFNKYITPIEWPWAFVDMNNGKRTDA